MNVIVRTNDRFITVDGRKARYIEEGSGVPAILLHGSSLGSSADVFRRNLKALGAAGIRAIAVDLPGFGKSDPSEDLGGAAQVLGRIALAEAGQVDCDRADAGGAERLQVAAKHIGRGAERGAMQQDGRHAAALFDIAGFAAIDRDESIIGSDDDVHGASLVFALVRRI